MIKFQISQRFFLIFFVFFLLLAGSFLLRITLIFLLVPLLKIDHKLSTFGFENPFVIFRFLHLKVRGFYFKASSVPFKLILYRNFLLIKCLLATSWEVSDGTDRETWTGALTATT
jgi:hypothetical protein